MGKYPEVSLAEARERVATFRRQVRDGLDPIEERRKAKDTVPTFAELAKQVHKERAGGYRNAEPPSEIPGTAEIPGTGTAEIPGNSGDSILISGKFRGQYTYFQQVERASVIQGRRAI